MHLLFRRDMLPVGSFCLWEGFRTNILLRVRRTAPPCSVSCPGIPFEMPTSPGNNLPILHQHMAAVDGPPVLGVLLGTIIIPFVHSKAEYPEARFC